MSAVFIVIFGGSYNHGMMTALAQQSNSHNPCTAVNPCNQQVCGDHICAPGEYVKMQQALAQAQIKSSMENTTNATAGNNQALSSGQNGQGQSAGQTLLGVVAYNSTSSDGTLVILRTGFPLSGQPLSIGIAFLNGTTRNYIQNQNYAITVTQDNAAVLSNQNVNTRSGIDTLTTSVLKSTDPVNIKVTLNGVGLPTADPSTWKGVKGQVLSFGPSSSNTTPPITSQPTTPTTNPPTNQNSGNNAVPEFGSIAPIVLTIAIFSIIVFTVRSKGIAKLYTSFSF